MMLLITGIHYRDCRIFFSVNVYGIKFGTIAKLREIFYLMFEGKEICAYCIISCF